MTKLTLSYRAAIPVFLGGATQRAEFRVSSFKGALRFWWRALHGNLPTTELHRRESAIFGSSDQAVGRSKVKLILRSPLPKTEPFHKCVGSNVGIAYLAYGLNTRTALWPADFRIELVLSPLLTGHEINSILLSAAALGTIGGLGARSRRGLGSTSLVAAEVPERLYDLEAVSILNESCPTKRLQRIVQSLKDRPAEPRWTAFSSSEYQSLVAIEGKTHSATELLGKIGRELVLFRSWGQKADQATHHMTLGEKSEQKFQLDHELFTNPRSRNATDHPERIVFGLPQNYYSKTSGSGVVKPKTSDRRASPLFIHVNQVNDKTIPIAHLVYLPAPFLPEGEQVESFGRNVPLNRSSSFHKPVTDFLTRLVNDKEMAAMKVEI